MALTSITKAFVVKSGLTVEGTGTVTTSTGASSALQVNGGASIAKNLIVGTTATVYGPASFLSTVNAGGQSTFGALTATVFTATSAHIIGDASVDGSVITTLVTSTSYLALGAGGTSNDVEIQTNGHATQFLASGQIRPSGMLMGSSYDSNQVDVTNIGPLLLKGLAYGVQLTTSPNTVSTYVWTYGTDGTLTNPGNVIVQSSQTSTSTLTGALTVSGGVGIGGDLYVGGSITAQQLTVAYTTVTQSLVTSPDVFTITNTTISISTTSGALVVAGGVGIGGSTYIGADLKAQTLTARALATATNNLVYADNNGQLQITPISFSGGTINGTITYANTATNLSGGRVGSLPYQTSTGTTTMLPIGSNLQVLTVSGGVPVWADSSGTTVGNSSNAVTATNIAYGLANEIPYQQSPGITIFNSGFTFDGTTFTATNIVSSSGNNATSSTGASGALMVNGGAGISKDLYVGGNINVNGTISHVTSNAGTFNTLTVTGTNIALTVTNSAYIGQNLQVGGIVTATNIVTGKINASSSTFVASISGTTMTVTSANDGTIAWGQAIIGAAYDTYVVIQLTQTSANPGGNGTYKVSQSQNLSSTTLAVQSVVVDSDIKLTDGHGIFIQDADSSYLYDNLISIYEDDATIKVGSINTNGLSLNNNKEFKAESALNTGTFMALAKVDSSDNVILSSGNSNTTQIRVGGDSGNGFGYGAKFFNGGEAHIPTGLRVGNDVNVGPFGGQIEINADTYATLGVTSYRNGGVNDQYGAGFFGGRYRGVTGAPLPVQQDDYIVEFGGNAWDGTGLTGGGEIVWRVDGSVTSSSNPSRVELYVTQTGTKQATLGLVVNSSLQVITYGDLLVQGTTTASNLVITGSSILHAVTATTFTATNATINGTLGVIGQSTLGALTATTFTATTANIIGNETVGGILTVNTTTDSTLTTNGSIVTAGGVGIAKNVIVGGAITIGSSISSSTVASIYSNNSVYASFTSNVISNNSQQLLDSFVSDAYRTAKYLVQIVDTTGNKIHVEEILLFHDGASVYMNEYAIATNTGELGTFDATFGGGYVTLTFTPNYTPGYMTIKVNRTAITK